MKDKARYFTQGQIEKISKVLGDTYYGLTGSEIGYILQSVKIADTDPNLTKWKRLFNAFVNAHNNSGKDNFILSFIAKSLEPSRFTGEKERYHFILGELNTVLSFQGLEFRDDGKFYKIAKSNTLSEAESRAFSLKEKVIKRGFHTDLLKYCESELLQDNYFHAVLEAVKGIASMIRKKTDCYEDGSQLVEKVFCGTNPLLKINKYSNETEKSEQKGFANLLKGIFGTFRNTTAHAAKIEWDIEEQDALDFFAIASYSYRRIEQANLNNDKS